MWRWVGEGEAEGTPTIKALRTDYRGRHRGRETKKGAKFAWANSGKDDAGLDQVVAEEG